MVRIILSKNAGKQTFVKKRKHFGENKNLLKQNLRVKQNFWSKKLLVKKNVGSKNFWVKQIFFGGVWGPKILK